MIGGSAHKNELSDKQINVGARDGADRKIAPIVEDVGSFSNFPVIRPKTLGLVSSPFERVQPPI